MERRQIDLRLETEEERVKALQDYLRPVKLASRLVSAACLIVARGHQIQVGNQRAVRLAIPKSDVSQVAKQLGLELSPNTWLKAIVELESKRIVGVLRTTSPWTYVLSLDAIGKLQPAADDESAAIAALPIFGAEEPQQAVAELDRKPNRSGSGQGPVTPGHPPRVRVESNLQNPCTVRSVVSATEPAGLADRMVRPWHRQCGLTGEDLAWAVASGKLECIRRLYREGKQLEWIGTSEDDLVRFLTAVHHCATCPGLDKRMGALTARVKRDPIDVRNTRQASDKWAADVIRKYQTAEVSS
jgi:hypothetical protein